MRRGCGCLVVAFLFLLIVGVGGILLAARLNHDPRPKWAKAPHSTEPRVSVYQSTTPPIPSVMPSVAKPASPRVGPTVLPVTTTAVSAAIPEVLQGKWQYGSRMLVIKPDRVELTWVEPDGDKRAMPLQFRMMSDGMLVVTYRKFVEDVSGWSRAKGSQDILQLEGTVLASTPKGSTASAQWQRV